MATQAQLRILAPKLTTSPKIIPSPWLLQMLRVAVILPVKLFFYNPIRLNSYFLPAVVYLSKQHLPMQVIQEQTISSGISGIRHRETKTNLLPKIHLIFSIHQGFIPCDLSVEISKIVRIPLLTR